MTFKKNLTLGVTAAALTLGSTGSTFAGPENRTDLKTGNSGLSLTIPGKNASNPVIKTSDAEKKVKIKKTSDVEKKAQSKTSKSKKTDSTNVLPRDLPCDQIISDSVSLGSVYDEEKYNPIENLSELKLVKVPELIPSKCAKSFPTGRYLKDYSSRLEIEFKNHFGSDWAKFKYHVGPENAFSSEGKTLVKLLADTYKTGSESQYVVRKILSGKNPNPKVSPASTTGIDATSKIVITDKKITPINASGLEKMLVAVIEANPGQGAIARFKLNENGKYDLLTINDAPSDIKDLTEEQVFKLVYNGVNNVDTTNRTAETFMVEVINNKKPEIITGYEFVAANHAKLGEGFVGKEPEKYLDTLARMSVAHNMAANYVANNTGFINHIKYDKNVDFWKDSWTIIVPVPLVESNKFISTAGTGNQLVVGDYNAIVKNCYASSKTNVSSAANCVFTGIDTYLNKATSAYAPVSTTNFGNNGTTRSLVAPTAAVKEPTEESNLSKVSSKISNFFGNLFSNNDENKSAQGALNGGK